YAQEIAAPLHCFEHDFGYETHDQGWSWRGSGRDIEALPMPNLQGGFQLQNAAAVLMVLESLAARLPVSDHAIKQGLSTVSLAGRFQILPDADTAIRIFDVAHNPHAAAVLAQALREQPCRGRTLAVFSMLTDKDIAGVVRELREVIDAWYIAGLAVERGSSAERLAQHVQGALSEAEVHSHETVTQAYEAALHASRAEDRVVVFGSFYTVAEALRQAYNK
ncbi:MAG: cyanophycin synthetase, partial [Gammaproteobacteria bacterium]